jgi:hypothetical protein
MLMNDGYALGKVPANESRVTAPYDLPNANCYPSTIVPLNELQHGHTAKGSLTCPMT